MRLVLGRPAICAASVRGKIFERRDHPPVLFGMPRTPADVRERQRRQQAGDRPLAVADAKALLDHPLEIDAPPANHAVDRRIGAGLDDHRQLCHLRVRQPPPAARTRTVLQAVRPLVIEPMRPIPQRLAIHAADLRGVRAAHTVVNRRQSQKTANLARIATGLGQAPNTNRIVIVS